LLQPVPERGHAIQHFTPVANEIVLVDLVLKIVLLQLFLSVAGVLRFQPVVPCEKAEGDSGAVLRVVARQAIDQLLPEPRGSPVLHGKASRLRNRVIFVAVEPHKLVAEEQRRGGAETPLADFSKLELERLRNFVQPFEMSRLEAESTALDRSFGADELRISSDAGIGPLLRRSESDANLVRQNFLGRPHSFQRIGVDHFGELSEQEEIGEDRKLHQESAQLCFALFALAEPGGVAVIGDHAMPKQLGFDPALESEKALRALEGIALLPVVNRLQRARSEPGELRRETRERDVHCRRLN
jgi:hypothetical protein